MTTWLITRERADAEAECARLCTAGIHARPFPCVATRVLPWPWSDAAPETWTMFTSRHAVESWFRSERPSLGKVAALAPATAALLQQHGVIVSLTADSGAHALAQFIALAPLPSPLPASQGEGVRIIVRYPTSDAGLDSPEQQQALNALSNFNVDRRVVYETIAPPELATAPLPASFGAVFFSPSAVRHFLAAVTRAPTHAVCFGQSTANEWNTRRPTTWPSALLTRNVLTTLQEVNKMIRLRRLRQNAATRALFAETQVTLRQLVQPYFVVPGKGIKRETRPGYGLWQISADQLREEIAPLVSAGVGGVMLFGVPEHKRDDGQGLEAQLEPLRQAITEIKSLSPELPLFADVCLCAYTTHGHCGLVKDNVVLNDESVRVLAEMSVHFAAWGVDFVCPSDMMDGRVRAIRRTLDERGHSSTSILSYAIKMASAFYGPFREAAHSAPSFGDRKTYQMPAHNRREARRELLLDVEEGADALLVKPALSNLDLLRDAREATDVPLFAYQVSGEYATLRAAGDAGLIDFDRAVEETLVSIRRAGADVIISYAARPWALR